ncbi:MAG TPA: type II secretion system protein [Gemmatimonadaceae bacterium]|nr:type II secretion system protein [Gemmatimonadaceae bacterium]
MTLVELAVVLALVGLIGTTIGMTLLRQQRFYRGATELLQAREGVRDALDLLATDIRGMSIADTVRLFADSAMEFFANIGSSVVCQTASGTSVGLPNASFGRGNTLTSFLVQPDTGDIAVLHRDSNDAGSEWERHRITGFGSRSPGTSCQASSGFVQQTEIDAGRTGFNLELATALSAQVKLGAPVRFIRRGRYSLYRASDGRWYLGYRRCDSVGVSGCGAIQPLSGPYRNFSTNPRTTGLLFEYFDAAGNRVPPTGSPLDIARVDVTARAESRQRILVEGGISTPADSATVVIAVRNRAP